MLATLEPSVPNLKAPQPARLAKATPLHPDHNTAVAQILASLAGGDTLPEDGFKLLADHARKLRDDPDDVIADSLARQAVLLESLWLHFAHKGATSSRPDHAAALVKAALGCQRALLQILGTINSLNEDSRNVEAVEC